MDNFNSSSQLFSDFPTNTTRLLFAIFGFSIGILSVIFNLLAIIAISRIRGSLPANIRLVCCLVAYDLLVSIATISDTSFKFTYHSADSLIFNVTNDYKIEHRTLAKYDPCVALFLHVIRYTAYNGTLLSLTALATDLYVAIMYPLNYLSLMRKDRVNFIIIFIFVIGCVLGSCVLYFPNFTANQGPSTIDSNYCFDRWQSHIKSCFATFGIVLISVIVVSIVYITVFYQIRNFHKNGVRCIHRSKKYSPDNNIPCPAAKKKHTVLRESSNSSNLKKNQRGLTTTLVLLLVFLCCFLPSFFTELYLMISANSQNAYVLNHNITLTIALMNLPLICSALDPLLYSYRLKDIQLSYLKLFCCYRDENKPNLPPLVAGRARPHPTVPVYQPTHRRSIACTSPNSTTKQCLPWSQRLANATGIYIERIRKISSQCSSDVTVSHKRTPTSAPPFDRSKNYENNNNSMIQDNVKMNPRYTVPAEFSMATTGFISPPNMVLCTWNFANKPLKESWMMNDISENRKTPEKSVHIFGRAHKFSSYSSSECNACCGQHSGSIDSANTNSTGTAGSCNQTRSHSFDHCKEKSINRKPKTRDLPNKIIE